MAFDGTDGQAGDVGNFGELELFDETEEKDAALALGELADGLPYESQLLVGDEAGFRRAFAVGNVRGDFRYIEGSGRSALPEAKALGTGVVADEIEGEPHEPGGDGTVGAEAGAGGPGAEEGFLCEGLGEIGVADGGEKKAVDALLVESDDGGQVVEWGGRGLVRCVEGAGDGGVSGHGFCSDRDEGISFHTSIKDRRQGCCEDYQSDELFCFSHITEEA